MSGRGPVRPAGGGLGARFPGSVARIAVTLVTTALMAVSATSAQTVVGPRPQQATAGAAGSADSASAPNLPASVAAVLRHPALNGASVGIHAIDVASGDLLIAHNDRERFAPASVTKLFTTAAALWRLGPHFVWQTPIATDGAIEGRVLDGNLWILGRGAPDLVEERLWVAAQWLAERRLDTIRGDIVVDDRYFDEERFGNGWPGGRQVTEAYHAPISALMANFGARRVGNDWQAVEDPALYLGERLRDLLGKAGVTVQGRARRPDPVETATVQAPSLSGVDTGRVSVPPPLKSLHVIDSEPLGRLVMDINKFSNNVMSESLLKTLGAIEYGAPGTATKGLALIARFLDEELGVGLNEYVQADGSGLSPLNRYTPAQVVRLLSYAHGDFHLGPELIASLKLSGLDGWNPAAFENPPLQGELRVKSGHIRGVNALSGLIHTAGGRILAFCAMVGGHRAQQWEVDQRMAEIALALIREY